MINGSFWKCSGLFGANRESFSNFFEPYTPPKINIEPENVGLEDDFAFELGDVYVPC